MKTIIIGGVADGTSEADGLQPARRRQKAGAKYSLHGFNLRPAALTGPRLRGIVAAFKPEIRLETGARDET